MRFLVGRSALAYVLGRGVDACSCGFPLTSASGVLFCVFFSQLMSRVACQHMGVAQNSRVGVLQVLVFVSTQGAILGIPFASHSHIHNGPGSKADHFLAKPQSAVPTWALKTPPTVCPVCDSQRLTGLCGLSIVVNVTSHDHFSKPIT